MRIAFYAAQAGKLWTGDTLQASPLGGSETAVIYVARGLAQLGHEVFVFTRGRPGVYDDVVYLDFDRARNLLRTLPLDVLVCSRDAIPLGWPHRAGLTVLWNHDLPNGRLPETTLHAYVSAWQAGIYVGNGFAPRERARVLPNGVDNALFRAGAVRTLGPDDVVKLAWTSNPERGLWNAGRLLSLVRRDFPKAELHVWGRNSVYGWGAGYEGNFLPDAADMAGVVLHESLPKAELAEALSEMDLWAYPTWWPETYCIAAVEAQAAGLPVVAPDYGALSETCKDAGLLINGNVTSPGHLEAMAEACVELLRRPEQRLDMQRRGLAYAASQDWSQAVGMWSDILLGTLGLKA